ncbi:hypothetical protein M427DRAFT_504132 [Gonapodya prolifera JEL478]|uniref:Uncharacterized protein n=1 Tax=Gonapodya prolifera (strain JEL478) TaxID=1344416 RepID=A0A139A4Y2_GONPJ|nr:hypothetical protein M427DRAFT_504132 [Gonapodya prolifera JEL478]|eukprot:KXS11679.1 hypothetical protein M427DRAFT_504132 [Gonapodya prolifera JEL478]
MIGGDDIELRKEQVEKIELILSRIIHKELSTMVARLNALFQQIDKAFESKFADAIRDEAISLEPDYAIGRASHSNEMAKIKRGDVYYIHVAFAYLVMLAGFGCLFSRVIKPIMWMHVWFGRFYWIFMLWTTATSLLIHNTGLPLAVLISFIFVGCGMTFGWLAINVHQIQMTRNATAHVQDQIKAEGAEVIAKFGTLERMIMAEKGKIAMGKSFRERIVSFKALHGALMITSWINIIGRIFVTPLVNDFSCHTYPYYKQIDTKHFAGASAPLTAVPELDPMYARLPWSKTGMPGWGAALSLGPFLGSFLVGVVYVVVQQYLGNVPKAGSSRAVAPVEPRSSIAKEKLLEGAGQT